MVPGPDGRTLPGPDTLSGKQTGNKWGLQRASRSSDVFVMRKQVGNDHIYKYQWLDKCEDVHHYALDADVNLCTSVLVSLLSQMTTPAVPMAALSPMVLTRSACQEEIIQRRCKRVAAQQAVFFFSLSLCT